MVMGTARCCSQKGDTALTFWGNIYDSLQYCEDSLLNECEVFPRFLIEAPDGAHTLFALLDVSEEERNSVFLAVRAFMILKAATSFVLATGNDAASEVSIVAISRSQMVSARQTYREDPAFLFDPPNWLSSELIPAVLVTLLPGNELELTPHEFDLIAMLENGEMPPNLRVGARSRLKSARSSGADARH
jgi:hypothetical protein